MTATLTTVKIEIPDDVGLAIIQSETPLEDYRKCLAQAHKINPASITGYDVDNLRRACVVALGEKELAKLGVSVPAAKED